MIPYVISIAYPSNKMPYLHQNFGVIQNENLKTFLLDEVCSFLDEKTEEGELTSEISIVNFFNDYYKYSELIMDNLPWSAKIFYNNEWIDATPTSDEIWQHIQLPKNINEINDVINDKINDKNLNEINDDDNEILSDMTKYFKELFNQELDININELNNLTDTERLMLLLSKTIKFTTLEKYNENKDLFRKFFNLCFKCIHRDVNDITNNLENEYDNTSSEKLRELMELYSNMVEYKSFFGF